MLGQAPRRHPPARTPSPGLGTRRDPPDPPYGTSQAEAETYAAAAARARDASEIKPLELKEYPKPEKSDRSGVLSWAGSTPPAWAAISTALCRRSATVRPGWVTEVDPGNVQQYDEIVERLTEAGVQPMVRIQDPYGDLPPGGSPRDRQGLACPGCTLLPTVPTGRNRLWRRQTTAWMFMTTPTAGLRGAVRRSGGQPGHRGARTHGDDDRGRCGSC